MTNLTASEDGTRRIEHEETKRIFVSASNDHHGHRIINLGNDYENVTLSARQAINLHTILGQLLEAEGMQGVISIGASPAND